MEINSADNPSDSYISILMIAEIPGDYPQSIPFLRLKNSTPNYLENRQLVEYIREIRALAHQSTGNQMMVQLCERLR